MLVYWSLFLLPACLALRRVRVTVGPWGMLGLLLSLLIGLRYEVGGDWQHYLEHFELDARRSFADILRSKEMGFHLLNWLVDQVGAGAWLVNLVCGVFFAAGLVRFCRSQPAPFMALAVAVPYLVIVVGMGYQRQAVALGLLMWGLVDLLSRRYLSFVVAVALGALFHQTVLLMLPLAALANTRKRWWTMLWVSVTGLGLYQAILAENANVLWANYVESGYASEGGPIRVAMNALPAMVFLLKRNVFPTSSTERSLWTWMAVFSLACVPLIGFASTAVDRVALYFMPIQMMVWNRVPDLFVCSQRLYVRLFILAMYAATLFVWLQFAVHSKLWLPYRFWPLVWLENI